MKLIRFLLTYTRENRQSRGILALIVITGAVSGISNALLLALISSVLTNLARPTSALIWGFVGMCLLLPTSRFISESLLTRLTANTVSNLRMQLSRRILFAPLKRLEELGTHRLLATLTDDIPSITGALIAIPVLCINIAVVIASLIYMAWLSPLVLLILLTFMAIGVLSYQLPVLKALGYIKHSREHANALFKHFRALTEGIKELKLHSARREAFLTDELLNTVTSLKQNSIKGDTIYSAANSWGQVLIFVLIGLILFVLPSIKHTLPQTLTGYTLVLLYIMTPLQIILNMLPNLGRANIAVEKVNELGMLLSASQPDGSHVRPAPANPSWDSLQLIDVTHTYYNEAGTQSFMLGPINLTFYPAELVFLVGGNGSGKTTFAKLLTGLYEPEGGRIQLDFQPITDERLESYRQNFAVVFSDFFVFERLLGLYNPEIEPKIREYLTQLQLDEKVHIENGVLSTTNLSRGQRKRLALLTAYLEDRPFYVFDEWAADQDPLFKEVFYLHLLPGLKARGKAVLAITHDDKYYQLADRIIKLDYGKIESEKRLTPAEKESKASMLI